MSDYTLVHADCMDAMREMAEGSVDAIVTDPPYHLTTMSRGGSARKPGTGPFGRHRVGEKGFMGKTWDGGGIAFDPATWAECLRLLPDGGRLLSFAGARTAHRITCAIEDAGFIIEDVVMWLYGSGFPKHRSKLKPAYEPIVVARKGGASELNIDAGRIGTETVQNGGGQLGRNGVYGRMERDPSTVTEVEGRWPANVALDEEAARLLDLQYGPPRPVPGTYVGSVRDREHAVYGPDSNKVGENVVHKGHGDTGQASRFFYTAKAPRAEREHGLEGAPRELGDKLNSGMVADREAGKRFNNPVGNHHPTVKPVDLMRWLVRLVAKPGQTVLDPFMGSGTTGVACTLEGVGFVGIEREAEYLDIARRRIVATQPNLFGGAA